MRAAGVFSQAWYLAAQEAAACERAHDSFINIISSQSVLPACQSMWQSTLKSMNNQYNTHINDIKGEIDRKPLKKITNIVQA